MIKNKKNERKNQVNIKNQKEQGITLLVLATTIIVLLILAGITIASITGNNGMIKQAQNAKKETEISEEKEAIELSTVVAIGENEKGNLENQEFQEALNKYTNGKAELIDSGDEFEVLFTESNRFYTVDKDGNILKYDELVQDKYPGDITKDENGEELNGEDKPYKIYCIEDLIEWSQNYAKYKNSSIELGRTLNFKSKLSYQNSETMQYGDINKDGKEEALINEMQTGIGFTPISNYSGNFQGNGYEINNIFISNKENVGLFSMIEGAKISNLGISGNIQSTEITKIEEGVGGIVGCVNSYNTKSIIENCWNKVTVTAFLNSNYTGAGGIMGNIGGAIDIINCYNEGNVIAQVGENAFNSNIGSVSAGGIVGYVRGGKANANIYNSYNIGNITIDNKKGSGILGGTWAEGLANIENCFNIGNADFGISRNSNILTVKNVYYINTINNTGEAKGAQSLAKEDIYNQNFVNTLNNYIDSKQNYMSNWKKWKLGEQGYPVFAE